MYKNSVSIQRGFVLLVIQITLLFSPSDSLFARSRIVLNNSKPLSTQIVASDKGAMYLVEEEIDLRNSSVKLPQGAILQFDGGSFSNGTIVGNASCIVAGRYEIFNNINLSGSWSVDGIPVEWFGAVANSLETDCTKAINKAVSTGVSICSPALLGAGTYYTKSTVDLPANAALIGSSPSSSTVRYMVEAGVGVYMHGQNVTLRDICVREHNVGRKGICIKVGDKNNKVACTRGYIEDITTIGGSIGLDLEYQWCNKISGVNCRYNGTGVFASATTPYIENAVIEGNYKCGIQSEESGVKLYNAVIEGNTIGCILNGRENLLNNCYFEGNTASWLDKNAAKDVYGFDKEGGHIYAGETEVVSNLIMIGCHIVNTYKHNNTIRIDKCLNFTAIGCRSLSYMELTENCTVKYIDDSFETVEEYGEYSLASKVPKGFSVQEPILFSRSTFKGLDLTDTTVQLDEQGYYRLVGNKTGFRSEDNLLLCFRKENGKYREMYFRVYDPAVLESDQDIVLSTTIQYPENMKGITPGQSVSLTGKNKSGKEITVRIGKGHTSTNQKIRAGQTATYDVRIKRSYIKELMKANGIEQLSYLSMYNSLIYNSNSIAYDTKAGYEFTVKGLSVSLASAR